ncbi:MAG: 50S ribosomal protein L3 N(5)-glutamine methyltransferase [Halioglobus sp.]|nr:50S ribosomal protein L3 N(5)-glutamine methyltransferase [Halioglobus sp.]
MPRSPIAELILNGFRPWYSGPAPERILDLCCGGGCIGLAAAVYCGGARVDLIDVDEDALDLAHRNAALHGLEGRVEILRSDLYEKLEERRYDLILCNPPYVNDADLAAMPAEYRAEPRFALEAGRDGLVLAHRVLAGAGQHLTEHGLLVLELGASWPALEEAYPGVPFTWVDFEHGGEGVCVLTAREWQDYSESWRR